VGHSDDDLIESELASIEENRKISDTKEQQTDLTYGQINKKVQANTMGDIDQNSDIDEINMADQDGADTDGDAASSVLSQSLRSTHSFGGGDQTRYYRYSLIATLRSAISWKNLTQTNLILKNVNFFFGLLVFRSQFGGCLQKFGGSRPAGLGEDRDCTDST
jgi:hypothetical protein